MRQHLPAALIGGVVGAILGIALALLLTQPTQSRQASTPRPAATILATLRPVTPLRTGAPTPGVGGSAVPQSSRSVEWPRKSSSTASPSPDHGANPTGAKGAETAGVGAPTPTPTHRPRATTRPAHGLSGVATYYDYRRGQAAAGPRLREEMGAGWRGETVLVNGVSVVLSDFMGTDDRDKIIDLDMGLFKKICGPLLLGVCDVVVRW